MTIEISGALACQVVSRDSPQVALGAKAQASKAPYLSGKTQKALVQASAALDLQGKTQKVLGQAVRAQNQEGQTQKALGQAWRALDLTGKSQMAPDPAAKTRVILDQPLPSLRRVAKAQALWKQDLLGLFSTCHLSSHAKEGQAFHRRTHHMQICQISR